MVNSFLKRNGISCVQGLSVKVGLSGWSTGIMTAAPMVLRSVTISPVALGFVLRRVQPAQAVPGQ